MSRNYLQTVKGGLPSESPADISLPEHTAQQVRAVFQEGTPENTRRAYQSDMRYFWAWAAAIEWTDTAVYPVPVEKVIQFITDHLEGMPPEVERQLVESGFKDKPGPHAINTVERRVSTLSAAHQAKNLPNPCRQHVVIQLLSKARKAAARRGRRAVKKKAIIKPSLDLILETSSGNRALDLRDRALLLFAWASGGRRRSEVAQAVVENLEDMDQAYIYHLGITKTDQEGHGMSVPITGKAASVLREWIDFAQIEEGFLFRRINKHGRVSRSGISDRTVARIVKNRIALAGLDPQLYSGHSLRSGFITEAGRQGKNLFDVMALSGHKTVQVAMGYHQAGAILQNEAASLLGEADD